MEGTPTNNPRDLIKKEDIAIVVKADKGSDAVLDSFRVEDFTKKGDNYACVVTSVVVQYTRLGKPGESSYVVKLNPCHEGSLGSMMHIVFEKETAFYTKILPLLNKKLTEVNEHPLRIAKHYHSVEKRNQEAIYLEDLRQSGFKMHDRLQCMTKQHVELIIKELARLHASSVLLFHKENSLGNILKKYPDFDSRDDEIQKKMKDSGLDLLTETLTRRIELIDRIPGYEFVSRFISEMLPTINEDFNALKTADPPFITISHGDCWNNNLLFR